MENYYLEDLDIDGQCQKGYDIKKWNVFMRYNLQLNGELLCRM